MVDCPGSRLVSVSVAPTPHDADLVVIGGGLAGISAGLRGAELGLRAVILEQGDDPAYACNTRISGGTMHVAYRSPYEPVEELVAAVERVTYGNTDPVLARLLATRGRESLARLAEYGATLTELDAVAGVLPQVALAPAGRDGHVGERGQGPDLLLQAMTQRGELLSESRCISGTPRPASSSRATACVVST